MILVLGLAFIGVWAACTLLDMAVYFATGG